MIIRTATFEDLKAITQVESICFPAAEAAPEASFRERLMHYPNHFWLLEDQGKLISFVNGMATNELHLTDEMFEKANLHDAKGTWQMIFGVTTLPEYRNQGYAGLLINRAIEDARKQGRKGLVLTCKEQLVPYYSKFGFINEGVSGSEHGGAVWYEMRIIF